MQVGLRLSRVGSMGPAQWLGAAGTNTQEPPLVKLWESVEGIQASLGSGGRQCGSRAATLVELLCVAWG